jgi:glycosyltransferase involved in cell wall biosynthesis
VDFSVIVCTYNRARNLPVCLGRLAEQEGVGELAWEVLVVDNNSSDGTSQTVEQLARGLPIEIRGTHEPQQGLNYARNTGIGSRAGAAFPTSMTTFW